MSQGAEGSEEGVSRNDPTIRQIMHPRYEAQIAAGRGDEPLDSIDVALRGAAVAAQAPADTPYADAQEAADDTPSPTVAPSRQFRHGPAQVQVPGEAPAEEAEPIEVGAQGDIVATLAAAISNLQAGQKQTADVLESTGRAVGAVADRLAELAPARNQEPEPLDPIVVGLAERLGVDPRELALVVEHVSSRQVAEFARTLDGNIRAAQEAQVAFQRDMTQVDPEFNQDTFNAYLQANPEASKIFAGSADKAAAGRFIWNHAKNAVAPPEAVAAVAGQRVERKPVAGARAAAAPQPGGQRTQQLSENEWRVQETERLRKATESLGDNHPLSQDYFMQRFLGGHKAEHFPQRGRPAAR